MPHKEEKKTGVKKQKAPENAVFDVLDAIMNLHKKRGKSLETTK